MFPSLRLKLSIITCCEKNVVFFEKIKVYLKKSLKSVQKYSFK